MLVCSTFLSRTFTRSQGHSVWAPRLCRVNLFLDTLHLWRSCIILPLDLNWLGFWGQLYKETKATQSALRNNGITLGSAARQQVENVFVLCWCWEVGRRSQAHSSSELLESMSSEFAFFLFFFFFFFVLEFKLILSFTLFPPPLPPLLPKPAFDLVLLASERNHLLVKGQAVTKECR